MWTGSLKWRRAESLFPVGDPLVMCSNKIGKQRKLKKPLERRRNVFKKTLTRPAACRDLTLETKKSAKCEAPAGSCWPLQHCTWTWARQDHGLGLRDDTPGSVHEGIHGFLLLCVQGYGAYLTLMMLKSTDSIFKCACAMSPVTDWKLYGESSGWSHAEHTRLEGWRRLRLCSEPVSGALAVANVCVFVLRACSSRPHSIGVLRAIPRRAFTGRQQIPGVWVQIPSVVKEFNPNPLKGFLAVCCIFVQHNSQMLVFWGQF